MKTSLLFAALLLNSSIACSQLVQTPQTGFYTSLHTYSRQFKDAFSFYVNPAALAGIQQVSAGVFSERRFLLSELSSHAFALALPTSSGNFGLSGNYFGSAAYNEISAGLAYGRNLGAKTSIGVRFDYFSMQAAGYGSAAALTFDAGLVLHLTDALQTGMHVYNPVGQKIGKSGMEKLPSIFSAGIGYDISPQCFLGAAVEKAEDQPLTINAGLQYLFAEKLLVRGGVSSASSVYFIGFGVQMKKLRLDATASFHPYLGVTPGLLFIYNGGQ